MSDHFFVIPYLAIEYFNVGGLKFYSWGFFIALAFLVGLVLSVKAGRKVGISPEKIVTLIVLVYFGAIIGARIFFVLQWPGEFLKDPAGILRVTQGGMMFYGGLFGGILVGWLYIRKWENKWQLVGFLSPVVVLSMAIGRVGCFLNSDHLGGLTNVFWAIRMSDGTLRHPVALYLILFDLALAGFLWWRQGRTKSATGNILMFLVVYSAGRFLLDFTRDASADPHFWGLATSQWLSGALLTSTLLYYIIPKLKKAEF